MSERTILMIEDSDDDAFIIKKILGEHLEGAVSLIRLTTAAAAGEFIKEHKDEITLILLDLGLSDAKGEDAFQRVKKYCSEIPIIILTDRKDHRLAMKLVGQGAENFINKDLLGFTPEFLRDAVDFAAGRRQLNHDKNLEALAEKDMTISWMSGGYSVQK